MTAGVPIPLLAGGSGRQIVIPLTGSIPPGWSFSRAGTYAGTYLKAGVVTNAPSNMIRNSTMVGAVAQDGVERVTNGNFALNPINAAQNTVQNGWSWAMDTGSTGTVVWNGSNAVTITPDGTHASYLITSISTTAGLTYTITANVSGAQTAIAVGTTKGSSTLLSAYFPTGTDKQLQFVASGTTTWLQFYKTSAGATTVSAVSVQSAGKLPTNWVLGVGAGLIRTITGLPIVNGIACITTRINGTTIDTGGITWYFEAGTAVAAATGQVWTESSQVQLTAGSTANITSFYSYINEVTSGAVYVAGGLATFSPTSALASYGYTRVFSGGGTVAATTVGVGATIASGKVIDITLTIAAPQLEQSPTASVPPVPTYGTAVILPRFESDANGTSLGYLNEPAATNLFLNSQAPATQSITGSATAHTLSFYGTGSIAVTGTFIGTLSGTGANNLVQLTFTPTVGVMVLTVTGSVTNVQLEAGSLATSRIVTGATPVTRSADNLSAPVATLYPWWQTASGYSFALKFTLPNNTPAAGTYPPVFGVGISGDGNNAISAYLDSGALHLKSTVASNSADGTGTLTTAGAQNTLAGSVTKVGLDFSLNGAATASIANAGLVKATVGAIGQAPWALGGGGAIMHAQSLTLRSGPTQNLQALR